MFYKLSAQEKKNHNFYDWPCKQRVNRRFRMKLPVHAKDMAIFFSFNERLFSHSWSLFFKM